ncbi:MAG: hypothetical protein OYH77_06340 [Pseudomonadota bacterium]|nr:hypothetical protein [Pseudomonadota bacterium]
MSKHIPTLVLLSLLACKFAGDEESATSAADAITERRKILEKIMKDYLQRLKESRITTVIDPKHPQGDLQVKVMTTALFGYSAFTQVSWNRLQADKVEVLRCLTKPNATTTKTCNFDKREATPTACGYEECKRVREKVTNEGTRLIDRSITTNSEMAASFIYFVRPCFENYLLIGKGKSETLVKCGDEAIKSSNAATTNNRYLAQRACGESAMLICGKSYPSSPYTKGESIKYIDTSLFDDREAIIKELEELSREIAREAQKGMKEALITADMTYNERMNAARQVLDDQYFEAEKKEFDCHQERIKKMEAEMEANANKTLWETVKDMVSAPDFWQVLAAAPFSAIATAPDCHQAQETAEAQYTQRVAEILGEEGVSESDKRTAGNQGYINCASENIETLLDYYNSDKELTDYDINNIADTGIAMIPLPKSHLNSRSTATAVQMSLHYLSSEPVYDDICKCPTCYKHLLKINSYDKRRSLLNKNLQAINIRIKEELFSENIKDPYAKEEE